MGLIGRSYTNRQIAQDLVVTVGTAGIHVEHILRKLDLQSRHQVADWARAHGLVMELDMESPDAPAAHRRGD